MTDSSAENEPENIPEQQVLRRSTRERCPPDRLNYNHEYMR